MYINYKKNWSSLDTTHLSNITNFEFLSFTLSVWCSTDLKSALLEICTSTTQALHVPRTQPHPEPLIRPPVIRQAVLARHRVRDYNFLFVVGSCRPRQPTGWLVPTLGTTHEDLLVRNFYWEHGLAYPKPPFTDMSGPETEASLTISVMWWKTSSGKGRGAAPWDPTKGNSIYRVTLYRVTRVSLPNSLSELSIAIRFRPSSVIFLHFHLLLQNRWADLNQTWWGSSLGDRHPKLFIWGR